MADASGGLHYTRDHTEAVQTEALTGRSQR